MLDYDTRTSSSRFEPPVPLIRPVGPADGPALSAMYRRSSPESRYRRLGGFLPDLPHSYLARCLAQVPEVHDALTVEVAGAPGQLVALASAALVPHDPRRATVELGILVEDAWQGLGLGRQLIRALLTRAGHRGVDTVYAQLTPGSGGLVRALGRDLEVIERRADRDGIYVRLSLTPPRHRASV